MIEKSLERILPERRLATLKEQGRTDKQIAEAYNITPADVLLLRGWYGIRPTHIKPTKAPVDQNKKPRFKRPMRSLVKWNHEHGFKLFEAIKWGRNEEIYAQYKLGYDIKKLAKMYYVTEKYLKGFIARRSREEKVKSSVEYQQTKGKPLTRDLLRKYKAERKADVDIGHLHGVSMTYIWKLRKKYGIKGTYTYRRVSITAKTRKAVLKEYQQGKPIDEICAKHGISCLRFSALFSRYLTPQHKAKRRAIVQDYEGKRKELLRLQKIHKTDTAIARSLGITRQRAHQLRVQHGIPPLASKKNH